MQVGPCTLRWRSSRSHSLDGPDMQGHQHTGYTVRHHNRGRFQLRSLRHQHRLGLGIYCRCTHRLGSQSRHYRHFRRGNPHRFHHRNRWRFHRHFECRLHTLLRDKYCRRRRLDSNNRCSRYNTDRRRRLSDSFHHSRRRFHRHSLTYRRSWAPDKRAPNIPGLGNLRPRHIPGHYYRGRSRSTAVHIGSAILGPIVRRGCLTKSAIAYARLAIGPLNTCLAHTTGWWFVATAVDVRFSTILHPVGSVGHLTDARV